MEAKRPTSVSSETTLAGCITDAHFLSLTVLIMGLSMLHGELGTGFSKPPFLPKAPSLLERDKYPGNRVTKMIVCPMPWPMTIRCYRSSHCHQLTASCHAEVSIRRGLAMLLEMVPVGMVPALGLLITKLNVLAWISRTPKSSCALKTLQLISYIRQVTFRLFV